jgi:hypothetical protein
VFLKPLCSSQQILRWNIFGPKLYNSSPTPKDNDEKHFREHQKRVIALTPYIHPSPDIRNIYNLLIVISFRRNQTNLRPRIGRSIRFILSTKSLKTIISKLNIDPHFTDSSSFVYTTNIIEITHYIEDSTFWIYRSLNLTLWHTNIQRVRKRVLTVTICKRIARE